MYTQFFYDTNIDYGEEEVIDFPSSKYYNELLKDYCNNFFYECDDSSPFALARDFIIDKNKKFNNKNTEEKNVLEEEIRNELSPFRFIDKYNKVTHIKKIKKNVSKIKNQIIESPTKTVTEELLCSINVIHKESVNKNIPTKNLSSPSSPTNKSISPSLPSNNSLSTSLSNNISPSQLSSRLTSPLSEDFAHPNIDFNNKSQSILFSIDKSSNLSIDNHLMPEETSKIISNKKNSKPNSNHHTEKSPSSDTIELPSSPAYRKLLESHNKKHYENQARNEIKVKYIDILKNNKLKDKLTQWTYSTKEKSMMKKLLKSYKKQPIKINLIKKNYEVYKQRRAQIKNLLRKKLFFPILIVTQIKLYYMKNYLLYLKKIKSYGSLLIKIVIQIQLRWRKIFIKRRFRADIIIDFLKEKKINRLSQIYFKLFINICSKLIKCNTKSYMTIFIMKEFMKDFLHKRPIIQKKSPMTISEDHQRNCFPDLEISIENTQNNKNKLPIVSTSLNYLSSKTNSSIIIHLPQKPKEEVPSKKKSTNISTRKLVIK